MPASARTALDLQDVWTLGVSVAVGQKIATYVRGPCWAPASYRLQCGTGMPWHGAVVVGLVIDGVLCLKDSFSDQSAGVFVGEAVEHGGAVPAGLDQTSEAHLGEVLGNDGWGLVDDVGDVAHRQLARPQCEDDADSGGVREHPENLGRDVDVGALHIERAGLRVFAHVSIVPYRTYYMHMREGLKVCRVRPPAASARGAY